MTRPPCDTICGHTHYPPDPPEEFPVSDLRHVRDLEDAAEQLVRETYQDGHHFGSGPVDAGVVGKVRQWVREAYERGQEYAAYMAAAEAEEARLAFPELPEPGWTVVRQLESWEVPYWNGPVFVDSDGTTHYVVRQDG